MRSCNLTPTPLLEERELEERNEHFVIDEGRNKDEVEDIKFG